VIVHVRDDGTWHYDLGYRGDTGSPGVSVPGGPAGRHLSRLPEIETAPGIANETPRTRGGPPKGLASLEVPRLVAGDPQSIRTVCGVQGTPAHYSNERPRAKYNRDLTKLTNRS
jgi:hypothetical protein